MYGALQKRQGVQKHMAVADFLCILNNLPNQNVPYSLSPETGPYIETLHFAACFIKLFQADASGQISAAILPFLWQPVPFCYTAVPILFRPAGVLRKCIAQVQPSSG